MKLLICTTEGTGASDAIAAARGCGAGLAEGPAIKYILECNFSTAVDFKKFSDQCSIF